MMLINARTSSQHEMRACQGMVFRTSSPVAAEHSGCQSTHGAVSPPQYTNLNIGKGLT